MAIFCLTHCNKIGEIHRAILLRRAFNPHIDFAA
jgi:hypothetical protein